MNIIRTRIREGEIMRHIQRLAVIGLMACVPVLGAGKAPPAASAPGSRSSSAPILQSVELRTDVPDGHGGVVSVVPDFPLIAPNGIAIFLRRELVDTNGAFAQTQIRSATIDIPPAAQKHGAVISGGWSCGVAKYYVTLRAYIMDADGNRSNSIEYTIHCNGG
jgi:hypothetical protein